VGVDDESAAHDVAVPAGEPLTGRRLPSIAEKDEAIRTPAQI
jgi:hypothetical protein